MATDNLFGDNFNQDPAVSAAFQQLIGGLQQQQQAPIQAPELEPVPGGVNPIAAAGGTFLSSLAQQLGAPGAVNANQQRLNQARAAGPEAEARNRNKLNLARIQRTQRNLSLQKQINDAELAQAQEMGNIDRIRMAAQKQAALDRQEDVAQKQLEEVKISGRIDLQKQKAADKLGEIEKRWTVKDREGNSLTTSDPQARLLLDEYDSFVKLHTATLKAMIEENEDALANHQPQRHSPADIAAEVERVDALTKERRVQVSQKIDDLSKGKLVTPKDILGLKFGSDVSAPTTKPKRKPLGEF